MSLLKNTSKNKLEPVIMDRILEDISKWPIEKRRAKLEEIYKQRIGVPLNLDNPKRFTEKTQWRKLYEDDPRVTRCINKLTFKQYVREKIGDGYTAPLIDVWHSPEDVRINEISNKCVIKSNCSGDGHYTLLVRNKTSINLNKAENEIKDNWFDRRNLHTNSFFRAYYPINPCVIVEELISDIETGVDEYKFLCFDGEPCCIYHSDEHFSNGIRKECSVSFYSLEWDNLGIQYGNHTNNIFARKPKHLREMLKISRLLSEGFSFVRVDFFENDDRFFLAEMTFTQGGGLTSFSPESFDYKLGKAWNLRTGSF